MAAAPSTTAWQRMWPALITFVLLVLVVGCLYWAKPVLIPTALAILLTFLLSPVVTLLHRRGLPRAPAVVVVVGIAGLLLVVMSWVLAAQAVQLTTELPRYQESFAHRIEAMRQVGSHTPLARVQQFLERISAAAMRPAQAPVRTDGAVEVKVVGRAEPWDALSWVSGLQPLTEPIASAGLVIVLLIYLLIYREDARSRVLCLIGVGHLTTTTKALDDAGRRISRYLLVQFLLNVGYGVVIGIGLTLLRVPHALVWGFFAALLRYIPIIGPWMAACLPVGLSLLISDNLMWPASVIALFAVCELVSNLIIEPVVFGQSIGVSQVALMVAIAFWTWLWGPVGLVLATPLTVCLVVLGKHVPALRFFDVMLGDEPVLTPDVVFYQRLLAHDEDEAEEVLRQSSKTLSPIEICDQVVIPALVHARQDRESELLTAQEFEGLAAAAKEIAVELELQAVSSPSSVDERTQSQQGVGEQSAGRLHVLGCAARDLTDAIALEMLQRVVDPNQFEFELASADRLIGEIVELIDERRPSVLFITTLPGGGLAHARHLCKRLRGRFADLKIVVGRWGERDKLLEQREQLMASGADYVGGTLSESVQHLAELRQFLRPAQNDPIPVTALGVA